MLLRVQRKDTEGASNRVYLLDSEEGKRLPRGQAGRVGQGCWEVSGDENRHREGERQPHTLPGGG